MFVLLIVFFGLLFRIPKTSNHVNILKVNDALESCQDLKFVVFGTLLTVDKESL